MLHNFEKLEMTGSRTRKLGAMRDMLEKGMNSDDIQAKLKLTDEELAYFTVLLEKTGRYSWKSEA